MKLYVYILLMMFLLGCGLGDRVKSRKYILENGTSKELKIDFFSSGFYKETGYIRGTGVVVEAIANDGGGRYGIIPSSAFFSSDSITVTYDNKKRQIYTRISRANYMNIFPDSRNILFDSVYTIENDELYRYTFTEEDYENAEIID